MSQPATAPPPLAVVFDCDGVLLESVEAKTRAFAELFSAHGPEAQAMIVAYHTAHGGMSRYLKFEHFYREVLRRAPTGEELADLDRRFSELCLHQVLAAPLVPGALEFLLGPGRGLALYVVSGTPQDELRRILRQRGLDGHFRGVFGSPEGKAAHLRAILRAEGLRPDQALMVGDSQTDLDAALETGVGFYGRGRFPGQACGPDLTGLGDHVLALGGGAGSAGPELVLRPAAMDDAALIFSWENEPSARQACHSTAPIAWDGHLAWLAASLANPERRLFIAELRGTPVGLCRVDREEDCHQISYGIALPWRGRGLGRRMLGLLGALFPGPLRAEVKEGNTPSMRLAEGLGLRLERTEGGVRHYRRG